VRQPVLTVITPAFTSGYAEPDGDTGQVEDDDMAREPEPIAELRRSLGARLATFRLAAELTQGQLAKIAICDRTAIVHIEKGRSRGGERFWQTVDDACHAGGVLLAAYLELEAVKAEREQQERDRRLETVRAKAAELRGVGGPTPGGGGMSQVGAPQLDELRRALLTHTVGGDPSKAKPNLSQCEAAVVQAHTLYQRADYDGAAQLLPLVISRIEAGSVRVHTKSVAYLAAAKLATKMGDSGLAWVAADRSLRLASESSRPDLVGIAQYQISCALFGNCHFADVEQTAMRAVEHVAKHVPSRREKNGRAYFSSRCTLVVACTNCGSPW
jgi:transcriptional regulator with XRE-family HTH domain